MTGVGWGGGVMALPEETWLSDFTRLGWREDLGLTLIWKNKGRARAAIPSSAERKNPSSPINPTAAIC